MKVCRKCLVEKPSEAFYQDVNMSDGTRNACKDCEKKRMADYWHRNKQRLRGKEWHGENPELKVVVPNKD